MAVAEGSIVQRFLQRVDDWWLAVAGVVFIIGSDFKYRTRAPGRALAGDLDSAAMLELVLYGAVAAYLLFVRFRPARVRRVPAPLFLAACFIGLAVLSVAYTPYPKYALVRCIQATILLAVVVVACMDGGRAHFHRFAHLYLLLISAGVAYGLMVPSVPISAAQTGRFTWLAVHPTASGAMACLAAVVAFAYAISHRMDRPGPRWRAPVYWALLAITAGGGLASHTRGAILAGLCGVAVVLLASKRGRTAIEVALVALVLFAGVAIAANKDITAYITRGEDTAQLSSLNNRTELWSLAFEATMDQPLFGNGITASRGLFYEQIGLGGGHNAVVNVVVELGVVGLLVWLALILTLVVGVHQLPRNGPRNLVLDRAILLGVISFLLVDSIVFEGPGSLANFASTWLFMCIGWYVVARRDAWESGSTSLEDAVPVPTETDAPTTVSV